MNKSLILILAAFAALSGCRKHPIEPPTGAYNQEENLDRLSMEFIDSTSINLCKQGSARVEVAGLVRKFSSGSNTNMTYFTFSSIPGRAPVTIPCSQMSFRVEAVKLIQTHDTNGALINQYWAPVTANGTLGAVDSACNVTADLESIRKAKHLRISVTTRFTKGNTSANREMIVNCE